MNDSSKTSLPKSVIVNNVNNDGAWFLHVSVDGDSFFFGEDVADEIRAYLVNHPKYATVQSNSEPHDCKKHLRETCSVCGHLWDGETIQSNSLVRCPVCTQQTFGNGEDCNGLPLLHCKNRDCDFILDDGDVVEMAREGAAKPGARTTVQASGRVEITDEMVKRALQAYGKELFDNFCCPVDVPMRASLEAALNG